MTKFPCWPFNALAFMGGMWIAMVITSKISLGILKHGFGVVPVDD